MTKQSGEVQFFLVHLEKEKVEILFTKLLSSGVYLELLDPRELGPKWREITFAKQSTTSSNPENVLSMRQIDQVVDSYSSIYDFEEKYETGEIDKILENWQEKYLLDAVQRLNNNSIINKKFLQQKSILKKVKNKWEVTIIKDLKALYTKYEIETKLPLIQQKLFKLDKDSDVIFACFAVGIEGVQTVVEALQFQEIDYEITSWTRLITSKSIAKEITYNLDGVGINPKLSKLLIVVYYLLCAFVIHDIYVGVLILITTLCAYRFDLKNKTFLSQVWTGLGAVIFGIIGGSLAGNMLQVLSMSNYIIVKEISNGLLGFLSLFQIVDWTNMNSNLLLNNMFVNKSFTPLTVFTIIFGLVVTFVVLFSQAVKVAQDYKADLFKKAIVRAIFIVTILVWSLVVLNLAPIWIALVFSLGLLIYQPDLQLVTKLKTLFIGEFGLFGFAKMFGRVLWFGAVFGILVLSSLVFNTVNSGIGDNAIILFILNIIISIILWQVTAFVVAKALKVNFIDEISRQGDNLQERNFDPISKYKYWKF